MLPVSADQIAIPDRIIFRPKVDQKAHLIVAERCCTGCIGPNIVAYDMVLARARRHDTDADALVATDHVALCLALTPDHIPCGSTDDEETVLVGERNHPRRVDADIVADHEIARRFIRAAGGAVATSSANRSGEPPALDAQQALTALDGLAAAILDGGPVQHGVASTILDCTTSPARLLRQGPIPAKNLSIAMHGSEAL